MDSQEPTYTYPKNIRYLRKEDLGSDYEPMIAITVYPVRAQPFNFIIF